MKIQSRPGGSSRWPHLRASSCPAPGANVPHLAPPAAVGSGGQTEALSIRKGKPGLCAPRRRGASLPPLVSIPRCFCFCLFLFNSARKKEAGVFFQARHRKLGVPAPASSGSPLKSDWEKCGKNVSLEPGGPSLSTHLIHWALQSGSPLNCLPWVYRASRADTQPSLGFMCSAQTILWSGQELCFDCVSLHILAPGGGYLKSRDGTGRAQKSRARCWMVGGSPVNL